LKPFLISFLLNISNAFVLSGKYIPIYRSVSFRVLHGAQRVSAVSRRIPNCESFYNLKVRKK
jgi:hypothetical protein